MLIFLFYFFKNFFVFVVYIGIYIYTIAKIPEAFTRFSPAVMFEHSAKEKGLTPVPSVVRGCG